jgi:hypothetical protein
MRSNAGAAQDRRVSVPIVDQEALERFLALTVSEVEAVAERARARTQDGRTWDGLCNVMLRGGYLRVEELGRDAAESWAAHLGVLAIARKEPHRRRADASQS